MSRLSATGCGLILTSSFLGWLFAGFQLAISSLVMRDAAKDLLGTSNEAPIAQWFGWLITAFLLGAAAGGYLFGWLGDRLGRARAMGFSILCYSVFSGVSYLVQEPWQLLVLRFLACLGVGGMWPNGIALVSEAWPDISRPILAGVIGTAANIGILMFSILGCYVPISVDQWRWTMLVGAAPLLLGVFVLLFVPESPRWLALRVSNDDATKRQSHLWTIFQPPLLRVTVVGIALGTIPLFGGWGSSNWVNPWAASVGERPTEQDPALKAKVLLARSAPGSISSLLGGALAMALGRRRCYFLLSLAALGSAEYMFFFLEPGDPGFLFWNGALGFFSGFFFGWLPLCLPEMFPTHARSAGAGVSFNFGRILTAFGVLVAAALLKDWFHGDYAQIGRLTSLVYALGMVVIWFAPDTSRTRLADVANPSAV